jgi:hypothetical protein
VNGFWPADGQKVLFISTRNGNSEIYVMNIDGSGQTRLTNNNAFENTPVSQPVWWSLLRREISQTAIRVGLLSSVKSE